MKFRINKEHFVNGLAQVMNVVGGRTSMPVLNNVLIEASEGHIRLSTTNLDLAIRCAVKAEVEQPGLITLPVKKLVTIVRELPQLEVSVEGVDNNQAKIKSGGSQFKVTGLPADEFPRLPEFENTNSFELAQDTVGRMLRSVSYAQSSDENRHILNGVFFQFQEGRVTLVATDGRRLALIAEECPDAADKQGSLILPAKTVAELERILGKGDKVRIGFNERQVAFRMEVAGADSGGFVDELLIFSKIVEGNFPNYRQVVPKETVHRIKVERELLLESVKRAGLVVSEKTHQVRFKVTKNLLEITGSSPEYGEAHEAIAIAFDGPEVQVAFNPQFFMDPLKALGHDEVYFEFKDDLSPGLIKTLDNFVCVVMPLRLN